MAFPRKPRIRAPIVHLDVSEDFDKTCAVVVLLDPELVPHAEQLLRFAKEHERRSVMLANLSDQIQRYERAFPNESLPKRQKNRLAIIEAVASMYLKAIKTKRDQDDWSAARKAQERSKDSIKNEVANLIKEAPRDREPTTRQDDDDN